MDLDSPAAAGHARAKIANISPTKITESTHHTFIVGIMS
jgi:hypothetical protein